MPFAVYGMGGFAREVAPLVQSASMAGVDDETTRAIDVVFVEDRSDRPATCNGLPVISFEDLISSEHRSRQVVVAIGDGRVRKDLECRCIDAGLAIANVTSPTARVLADNQIGPGSVLCDFVTITSNAIIGRGFQANIYSYVAHDCVIGDFVTFAPRVSCNGNVHIHDYAYVGTGAMFIQGKPGRPLIIGEGALVGMGAVVTKSVDPYTIVAGNPARPIKRTSPPD
jgi:sugar O-acyltransferase (sialic acid O-acetyltransferase NeuD family)